MHHGLVPKDFKSERRVENRLPATRLIDLLPCRASQEWKFIRAELADCSLHGLAVVVDRPMDVGQQFLVKLRLPKGVRLLLYTVHNCSKWEKSRQRLGAKFSGFVA